MKAKLLFAALSFLAVSFSTYANTLPNKSLAKVTAQTTKIDLNKADLTALIGSFKGIGKKRAQAIIAYRDSHHGFKSIEELAEVRGLGQHFVVANREKLNEVFTLH